MTDFPPTGPDDITVVNLGTRPADAPAPEPYARRYNVLMDLDDGTTLSVRDEGPGRVRVGGFPREADAESSFAFAFTMTGREQARFADALYQAGVASQDPRT